MAHPTTAPRSQAAIRRRTFGRFRNIAVGLSSLLTAFALPVIGHWVSVALKEREIQGHFVELAVNILREEPSKDTVNLRTWATQIINKYSGVPLDAQTKQDLIDDIPLFSLKPMSMPLQTIDLSQFSQEPDTDVELSVLTSQHANKTPEETPDLTNWQKPSVKIYLDGKLIHSGPADRVSVGKRAMLLNKELRISGLLRPSLDSYRSMVYLQFGGGIHYHEWTTTRSSPSEFNVLEATFKFSNSTGPE